MRIAVLLPMLPMLLMVCSTGSQASTLSKKAERELSRDGAACESHKPSEPSGETHYCLFEQGEFDGRNFGTQRGRSAYVISEIGHRCKEVEILDDVDFAREGEASPSLRRVSAKCYR